MEIDPLKLENQLCFPLYAAAREVVAAYTPYLDELGLTYTQYIAMMVLWEERSIDVRNLCKKLRLESGTVSPLLQRLEAKGLVTRTRNPNDNRVVVVSLTDAGSELRERALGVPEQVGRCVKLESDEAMTLYTLLYKVLAGFEADGEEPAA